MELKIITDSISALSQTKSLIEKISFLEKKNREISETFENFKEKVKKYIFQYTQSQNIKIQVLTQKIEQLEMVNFNQQNSELLENYLFANNYRQKKRLVEKNSRSEIKPSLITVLKEERIWSNLLKYLTANDLLSMLSIKKIGKHIEKNSKIYEYMRDLINKPVIQVVEPQKKKANPSLEQQDINQLIDKYVTQEYVVGKQIDKRLKSAMETLLRLQKSTDLQNLPQNKFNSAAELVMFKFPFDKTIELLSKSTSLFAKNSNSMTDWINFMQNSLAGLLYDGASVYIEASEISNLKDILVDKLRRAKEQIKLFERENFNYKNELKKYKEFKDYLVGRVHQYDLNIIGKIKTIKLFEAKVRDLEKQIEKFEAEKIKIVKENEENRKLMKEEILKIREKLAITVTQKKELVEAFHDLSEVFKSFSLKL